MNQPLTVGESGQGENLEEYRVKLSVGPSPLVGLCRFYAAQVTEDGPQWTEDFGSLGDEALHGCGRNNWQGVIDEVDEDAFNGFLAVIVE